ncbi:MAG: hypothetical protein ACFFDB_04515 [Promethearchaeota archaeon]
MTDVKKLTKISLIVDAVVFLIYGILITFLFDMTLNLEGWTNPYMPRFFGGILLVSTIIAILMLRKKEWEEIKLAFVFLLGLFIPVLITEITVLAVLGSTFGAMTIQQGIMNIIIESSLFALGIVAYIKQRS